jgi:hypothetical protein
MRPKSPAWRSGGNEKCCSCVLSMRIWSWRTCATVGRCDAIWFWKRCNRNESVTISSTATPSLWWQQPRYLSCDWFLMIALMVKWRANIRRGKKDSISTVARQRNDVSPLYASLIPSFFDPYVMISSPVTYPRLLRLKTCHKTFLANRIVSWKEFKVFTQKRDKILKDKVRTGLMWNRVHCLCHVGSDCG